MYQLMHQEGRNFEVWYCDDASITGKVDKGFGQAVKWDLPLLKGYTFTFFKNQAIKKEVTDSFFGVVNINLLFKLLKVNKCIVVIHGWQFFTYVMALFVARCRGHKVWYRIETPIQQYGKIGKLKRFILKNVFFKLVDKFLYIGENNKAFYKKFNIDNSRLIFAPYAVDNNRFISDSNLFQSKIDEIKNELNLPLNKKIILFSGKLIWQKNPLLLLKAFHKMNNENAILVYVGDGVLRDDLESYIKSNSLCNVYITGFVNQGQISKYYAICDLFVLCSVSETWGLSVNEAMCFSKPVIVSSQCGCAEDLVKEGLNGFKLFTTTDEELTEKMNIILNKNFAIKVAGENSLSLVKQYKFSTTSANIFKEING
jgi:glycosyltransferase involved in cell wall biosynthesis